MAREELTDQVDSVDGGRAADSQIDNSRRQNTTDLTQLHHIPTQ